MTSSKNKSSTNARTFEEKSAEYQRAKNRIFNNTTNGTNNQTTTNGAGKHSTSTTNHHQYQTFNQTNPNYYQETKQQQFVTAQNRQQHTNNNNRSGNNNSSKDRRFVAAADTTTSTTTKTAATTGMMSQLSSSTPMNHPYPHLQPQPPFPPQYFFLSLPINGQQQPIANSQHYSAATDAIKNQAAPAFHHYHYPHHAPVPPKHGTKTLFICFYDFSINFLKIFIVKIIVFFDRFLRPN